MRRIHVKYQELLKSLDLYHGPIDGLQGPNTTNAVKAFQRMNGLDDDGIVGPKTRRAMDEQLEPIADRQVDTMPPITQNLTFRSWPRDNQNELHRFYGSVGTGQMRLELPYEMKLAWDPSTKIKVISCHEKVGDAMYTALEKIKKAYKSSEITEHGFDLFGGVLNVRKIRGGNRWSTHAWGIAIDLDPARNSLHTSWRNAYFSKPQCEEFVDAWDSVGAYSLGKYKNFDAMHFQFCYR